MRRRRASGARGPEIDLVHDQCTRLENLLNDFLKFARVRSLDLAPGSLNEQLLSVLRLFDVQAREMRIRILPHLDNELPSVLLDRETIRAALMNLVKNALEAMPEGGALTVITRITRNGVALDLIDTGTGMDEQTALHMFDAFYSTKDGGSGLGLPTARKIIEAHGGRISVQSDVDAAPSSRSSSSRPGGSELWRSGGPGRPLFRGNPDLVSSKSCLRPLCLCRDDSRADRRQRPGAGSSDGRESGASRLSVSVSPPPDPRGCGTSNRRPTTSSSPTW